MLISLHNLRGVLGMRITSFFILLSGCPLYIYNLNEYLCLLSFPGHKIRFKVNKIVIFRDRRKHVCIFSTVTFVVQVNLIK